MKRLLTRGQSSPKLAKEGEGYESVILHLTPGKTCPWASEGCLAACLNTAGRGAMNSVQRARQERTDGFMSDRGSFLLTLDHELTLLERRAARKRLTPVARLNGTSDIPWETLKFCPSNEHPKGGTLFERHPGITFYDYTKSIDRADKAALNQNWPKNYSLTLSRSENWAPGMVLDSTKWGVNVAVVFDTPKNEPLPETFEGVRVIDGRKNDWRFNDPRGVVVGLSALGKARQDETGFVVRTR